MKGIVSAHLDDAILSCSVQVASGGVLLTVFAGIPDSGGAVPEWDALTGATDSRLRMQERRGEDKAASSWLSQGRAGCVHLPLLDAQYRTFSYDVQDVTDELIPRLAGVTSLVVPAALGAHPDHLLARDAALEAAKRLALPLTLYADLPYAIPFGWPEIVSGQPDDHFLRRSELFHRQFLATGLAATEWTLVPVRLSQDAQAAKAAAMACYRTQMPALDQGGARILTRDDALAWEAGWVPAGQMT